MEEMEDKKELRGSTSDDPQKRLYEAILCLSNVDEVERFLCDLLSEKELLEATKRFHIAELLVAGKAQRKIEERVRKVWGEASTTTVGRVKKSLTGRSSYNGYALVLKKIHQAQNVSERSG